MTSPTDSARLEQENAALRLRLAALEAAMRAGRTYLPLTAEGHDFFDAAISGSDSALREMMERAGLESILSLPGYDADHDTAPMATEAMLIPRVTAVVERILKGGGE